MDFLAHIPVSAAGMIVATVGIVIGAPLFATGLRTHRLRRVLSGLRERPLDGDASGVVLVRGTVSLESPLFAPLSGKPCAGYTLEVSGEGMRVGSSVCELRTFRLSSDSASARIVPDRASWLGAITFERAIPASEPLPERLQELLLSTAELRWLRDRRVGLRLVERALEVGSQVFVTGVARASGALANLEPVEMAATGTDDRTPASAASGSLRLAVEPELWIEADEPLGRVLVSREAPGRDALAPPAWQLALLVLGPALTMAGLTYVAGAAGLLLAGRL